nr:hypothetical protein [Lactobacillus delbrueckii]
LKLGTEYHGLSYDALTAHTAFVFLRYMFMSVEKRDDEDDRTIGELFFYSKSSVINDFRQFHFEIKA